MNHLKNALIFAFCFFMISFSTINAQSASVADKAEQGDPDSQFELALMYYYGNGGVFKNAEKSEKWALAAAEQGVVNAQVFLGEMYHYGDFLPQDDTSAFKWFNAAAEQGDDYAQWSLGNCYYFGAGVEQDYREAFKWYEMAAAQGNLDAYYSLGVCFGYGDCADLDYAESANWFLRAAQEGHADSQYNIGFIYFEGIGVKQDKNEGVKWIRKAADQGQEDAAEMLNIILNEGITIPGKLYTFDENSQYEISSAKSFKTIANADNSYGTFVVVGKINDQNHRDGVASFDVTAGQIDIHYRYFDDYLVAFNNDWHFIRNDSKIVDGLELSEDIRKGALILQTSPDHSNWKTVFEKEDMFQKNPVQVDAFYVPTEEELAGGCYYRAIIPYEIQRKNGTDNETQKLAEVYEFYLSDPALNMKLNATDTPIPTNTLAPTNTPAPTNTEAPTSVPTQVKPTVTPQKEVPQTYYFDSKTVKVKLDSGFSVEEPMDKDDPHYGWEIGKFMVSGFTSQLKTQEGLVFLKNVGDEITFSFRLSQNIDRLNKNNSLIIEEDTNGYDKYFNITQTNFKRGALFIRQKDYQNKYTTNSYMDFLHAKASLYADTDVKMLEEGDYEVGLDYSIRQNYGPFNALQKYSDYKIFFTFSIRNGNCMVYLFDTATGDELTNQAYTENGFTINLAKSRYLDITIERSILNDSANGLAVDTRFNKPAKDNEQFTDEGIYKITVSNRYTGAKTEKIIYVGTNDLLKAYAVTGLPIQQIRQMLDNGAQILADGSIVTPTPTETPTATFTPTMTETPTATATSTMTSTPEVLAQTDMLRTASPDSIETSGNDQMKHEKDITTSQEMNSFIQKNKSALIIGGVIIAIVAIWSIIARRRVKNTTFHQTIANGQIVSNIDQETLVSEEQNNNIDDTPDNIKPTNVNDFSEENHLENSKTDTENNNQEGNHQ